MLYILYIAHLKHIGIMAFKNVITFFINPTTIEATVIYKLMQRLYKNRKEHSFSPHSLEEHEKSTFFFQTPNQCLTLVMFKHISNAFVPYHYKTHFKWFVTFLPCLKQLFSNTNV